MSGPAARVSTEAWAAALLESRVAELAAIGAAPWWERLLCPRQVRLRGRRAYLLALYARHPEVVEWIRCRYPDDPHWRELG